MYAARLRAVHAPLRSAFTRRYVRSSSSGSSHHDHHRTANTAALLCAQRTLSSSSSDAAPHSYVDWLDTMWARLTSSPGTSSSVGVPPSLDETSLSAFDGAFVALQSALGVEPWLLLVLFGAATRLCTLGFSLYGDRASARMQGAVTELAAAQHTFDLVYQREAASALEVQLAASALKSERRRVFAAHRTSTRGCLVPLLTTPLVLYGLLQVSALCANPFVLGLLAESTGSVAGFAWCRTLGQPDPLYLLPALSCGLTLANFELSLDRTLRSAWMGNLVWAARLACLCVLPVAACFRAGVCLYFVGMSAVGLLQPLLLRSPRFRRLCHFPPRVTRSAVNEVEDALQARVRLQLPYLSHFLSPEGGDDDAPRPLFARAASAKPRRHRSVLGHTSPAHYALGDNPLMRERPMPTAHNTTSAADKTGVRGAKKTTTSTSRGLAFAGGSSSSTTSSNNSTSGWRSPQVSYEETDFLPDDSAQDTRK